MEKKEVTVGDSLEQLLNLPSSKSTPRDEFFNPSEDPLEYIQDFKPIHEIPITGLALEKMFILAQEVFSITQNKVEVYSLSIGTDHIIKDILIPAQNVGMASVFVEESAILEIIPTIRANNLTVLGWNHSHANFSVFFSGTDIENQQILLTDTANYRKWKGIPVKYVYGMTVNVQKEIYGVISTQIPTAKIFNVEASFKIIDPLPINWTDTEIRKEIRDILIDKVVMEKYVTKPKEKFF
ncbi:MAG: hypothetical protein ACTSYU_02795 [Promethearchaeota archaeon]